MPRVSPPLPQLAPHALHAPVKSAADSKAPPPQATASPATSPTAPSASPASPGLTARAPAPTPTAAAPTRPAAPTPPPCFLRVTGPGCRVWWYGRMAPAGGTIAAGTEPGAWRSASRMRWKKYGRNSASVMPRRSLSTFSNSICTVFCTLGADAELIMPIATSTLANSPMSSRPLWSWSNWRKVASARSSGVSGRACRTGWTAAPGGG